MTEETAPAPAADLGHCKRCGWKLQATIEEGCTAQSCSCRCASHPHCTCGRAEAGPPAPIVHEWIDGGDGWTWRRGTWIATTSDGETRIPLPGICSSVETVEAYVAGFISGTAEGMRVGERTGAEQVRRDLRQVLGVPDAASVQKRLVRLEDGEQ